MPSTHRLPLRTVLPTAIGVLLAFGVTPAAAFPIVYTLTGTIDSVDSDLAAGAPPFAPGDDFLLTVEIDSDATHVAVGGTGLQYFPMDAFSLTLAPTYVMAGDATDFTTHVNVFDDTQDALQAFAQAFTTATLPPDLGIFRPMQIFATLRDGAGATLSSTALPTALDLADWTAEQSLQVVFREPGNLANQRSVFGTIDGLSVAVPEPALAWLLAPAALALGWARRPGRIGA